MKYSVSLRYIFGLWMLLNGVNHFIINLWAVPSTSDPTAAQLLSALINSHLLDVVYAMQGIAGALMLLNVMAPFAMCALMPLSCCALFWALVLDQQIVNILLALLGFGLNGLLMLLYLPYFFDSLSRFSLAAGETTETGMSFDDLYVDPRGSTTWGPFVPALVVAILAFLFFGHYVGGRTAQFCQLVLLYPIFVLLTRRIRSQGWPALLVLIPAALMFVMFMIILGYMDFGESTNSLVSQAAHGLTALTILAGLIKK